MTEMVTAESYRSMLRVFEDLLMCRIRVESFCENSLQVINVNGAWPQLRPHSHIADGAQGKFARLPALLLECVQISI
jgi:hypothetical protein